jgi:putative heme iron utilization protein
VLTRVDDAAELIDAEEGALAHLNGDHAQTLSLYAARLAGEKPGEWRATGLDPDGLDLALGDRTARIVFRERVKDAGRLRAVLKELADRARAAD